MNYLDDISLVKKHILFTNENRMRAVCAPLGRLGIRGFIFMRHFDDGSLIDLATDLFWSEHFFSHVFSLSYDPYHLLDHMLIGEGLSLWLLNPDNVIWQEGAAHFGYGNGISIKKKGKNYVDTYCFYAGRSDQYMNTFFVNHLNLLKKFIDYFQSEMKEIIEQGRSKRVRLPDYYIHTEVSNETSKAPSQTDFERFLRGVGADCLLQIYKGLNQLSKRERQCIELFADGLTMREAADRIHLSPRTIESHIINARNKLGAKNVTELVSIYLQAIHPNSFF